jgi:hypothetical protein
MIKIRSRFFNTKPVVIFCLFFFHFLQGNAQENDTLRILTDTTKAFPLHEVTITGAQVKRNSTYQYLMKDVKPLVSVIGETDVLRYIATLPGVSQGMEGGLGFFVRGGNTGNNRIELDGVPVYGSAHLFGLFSVFPPGIVENVTFRSGKLPASSGGLLASLTQISSVTPSKTDYKGTFSLSPFLVGGALSGPIWGNKLSFQVAGRISLLRPEIQLVKSMVEMQGDLYPEVADLYAKLHYQPDEKNTIEASAYYSNDYFKYVHEGEYDDKNIAEENWGNQIFRLSWKRKMTDRLQSDIMVYWNRFLSGQRQAFFSDDVTQNDLRLQSVLEETALQAGFNYVKNNFVSTFGIQAKSQQIRPVSEKVYVGMDSVNRGNPYSSIGQLPSNRVSVFGDFEYTYKFLTPSAGYRGTFYQRGDYTVWDSNLRLALAIQLSKESGLELSFDQLSQFHHVMEGLPVGWSLDLLIPADEFMKPEKARQYYVGGFWTNQEFLFSTGVYYKQMDHLASYRNAINVFGIQYINWEEEVTSGQGESYGWETRMERRGENWNAALSYTLSKTDRLFNEINGGEKFPFKFDRRHILNFTGQILTRKRKNTKQHFNLMAAYSSGHSLTLPIGMYKGIEFPYWGLKRRGNVTPKEQENALYRQLMSSINGYSLPYYLRIDIEYNFSRTYKRFTSDLSIGIFNVLNRQNPYLIFYEDDRWKQLSIFPLIPSIRWTLEF